MDEMDLETMLALQEEEEARMAAEEEEEDLKVLRVWEEEGEAKENKFKKQLFQETASAKRGRDAEPLVEASSNGLDDSMVFLPLPASPEAKKRKTEEVGEMDTNEASRLGQAEASKTNMSREKAVVLRHVPDVDFQAVTIDSGERFYLRRREAADVEEASGASVAPSRTSSTGNIT